ncbi:MAG: hypothetical protein HKN66_13490 [Flavobacteriaceae bacterium]|nr:hypothetical protein [Flavobacteriaceae bacterium]
MINFFRKIRQKLLSENKFSKYLIYALGEILLVVVGILIALQVNNWNIAKKDRIREVKYLKNIELDLHKDLKSLRYNLEFRRKKYIGTNKLIDQINGMPIEDVTELSYNVLNTLMAERFTPNNATYTELSNSGNLNLISNDSIKILLLELEELYKTNNFGIDHETFDYREYISKPLLKYIDTDQLIPVFKGEKTITEQNITKDNFSDLFQSLDYKNGLIITNWITQDFIALYESIDSKSKKIIDMLRVEIENNKNKPL